MSKPKLSLFLDISRQQGGLNVKDQTVTVLDISALDTGATRCLEISRTDYLVARHHIPEKWSPQLRFYRNLQHLLIYSLIHLKRRVQRVWYEYVKATDHLENPGIDAILTKILEKWSRKA
jgi:hypothetical protein